MKIKGKVQATLLALCLELIFVTGQSEWVWGKNSNGNSNYNGNNNNRPSGGSSSQIVSSNGPSGSNLVPVNTVTIFGNGAGIVSGPTGSSSASGDQYFATQTGSGSQQPAVIVQVLQPGGTGSGLQGGGTGSNVPASPVSGSSNFPSNSNNYPSGSSNFPSSGNNFPSGSSSNFPSSPPSSNSYNSNNNNNDAIPSNSIRIGPPVQGEPRLFTKQLRNLFTNAISNLIGGGSSNSNNQHSSNSNNNGGFFPSGNGGSSNQGLINSLLQLSQGLGNRFPTASPLPVSSSEFNTEGGGGGGGGSSSSGFSNLGGNCKCVPDDQCRLPFTATGTCSSGTMCCRRAGTRTVGDNDDTDRDRDNTRSPSSVRFQPAALRAGLFGEIVRGTSNVIDDTLDLILAPFLTQEDQQKLATRLASSNRKS